MRPIVCCVGTVMDDWSKWLHYWLQKMKCFVPTNMKDSQQIINETKYLVLPLNALIYSKDAHSMYGNIDIFHAIE